MPGKKISIHVQQSIVDMLKVSLDSWNKYVEVGLEYLFDESTIGIGVIVRM